MSRPVIAYHVEFCTYGFWLPNDPRGLKSKFVRAGNISRHGPATFVEDQQSVAGRNHDRQRRQAAKESLKRPPVRFTGVQARAVARGLAEQVQKSAYVVWVCSLLPEHVHAVIRRHQYGIEQMCVGCVRRRRCNVSVRNCIPSRISGWHRGGCRRSGRRISGRCFCTTRMTLLG